MIVARPMVLLVLLAGAACVASLRLSQESTALEASASSDDSAGDEDSGPANSAAPPTFTSEPSWSFKEEIPKGARSTQFPNSSGLVRAPPLVDDRMNIYLSTVTLGSIYKISNEGKTLWTHQRGPGVKLPGVSAIMNGSLFAADSNGTVFSLDMETGRLNWNTHIGSIAEDTWTLAAARGIILAPAVNEDNLTFNPQRENNRVVALYASNGSIAWKYDLEEEKEEARLANPVFSIKKGSCVFADSVGWVYRLKLKTGAMIWKIRSLGGRSKNHGGGAIIGSPGNTVYLTWNQMGSGNVAAYNWTNGAELWRNTLQYPTAGVATVGYVGKGSGRQLMVVVSSGMEEDIPEPLSGDLAGKSKTPLKSRVTGLLAEGLPKPGTIRFWRDMEPWYGAPAGDDARPDSCHPKALSNPTIGADGTVYVGSRGGDLVVLHDENGDFFFEDEEVAVTHFGVAFHASPVLVPGMLLATVCDGLHVWKF